MFSVYFNVLGLRLVKGASSVSGIRLSSDFERGLCFLLWVWFVEYKNAGQNYYLLKILLFLTHLRSN